MTTGQMMFYGGFALLAITVLLAVVFRIKRPKLTADALPVDSAAAQEERKAYTTALLSATKESAKRQKDENATVLLDAEPAAGAGETALLDAEPAADAGATVLLDAESAASAGETVLLDEEPAANAGEAVLLDERTTLLPEEN